MIGDLCSWTDTTWGTGLIAGTLIVVGASHWGYLSGVPSISLPIIGNVGNLMGVVSVVGGVCLLTPTVLSMVNYQRGKKLETPI